MKHTQNENVEVPWHGGALKNANLKSCTADCSAGPMDTPFPDLQLVCQKISWTNAQTDVTQKNILSSYVLFLCLLAHMPLLCTIITNFI